MRYLAILLAVLCTNAHAGRDERIQELMEAQGLLQMFQQQIDYSKEEVSRQGKIIENQFMSKLNPSTEYKARFSEATQEMMQSLVGLFSAKEIVSMWADFYGSSFTDKEIEELIRYYTSPLGKKDVSASQAALVKFNEASAQKMTPAVQRAMEVYAARLGVIAKECKCSR